MESIWPTISILIRSQLTVLLLLGGWYAARRSYPEIPCREADWSGKMYRSWIRDYGYLHVAGVTLATLVFITLVWLI